MTTAHQASLSFTISWSLLKLMSIDLVIPSNHLVLCLLFSSYPQSCPASASFLMSWLSTSGGQNTGASALASVLPINIQDWFPLGLFGLISLLSKGLSRVFSNTETIYLRLGLESMFWDSNSAKTHSTRIQDLMKPRFLMSHHRKNSERDKVIIKKWI